MHATIIIKITKNEELDKLHNVELITVDTLQALLTQLEEDYVNVLKEGDKKLHYLREERHQLKIKDYHWQEKLEVENKANKWVKQNFEVAYKNKIVLSNKVKELEVMVKLIEDCIAELEACKDKCTKECAKISGQDEEITQLRDEQK